MRQKREHWTFFFSSARFLIIHFFRLASFSSFSLLYAHQKKKEERIYMRWLNMYIKKWNEWEKKENMKFIMVAWCSSVPDFFSSFTLLLVLVFASVSAVYLCTFVCVILEEGFWCIYIVSHLLTSLCATLVVYACLVIKAKRIPFLWVRYSCFLHLHFHFPHINVILCALRKKYNNINTTAAAAHIFLLLLKGENFIQAVVNSHVYSVCVCVCVSAQK